MTGLLKGMLTENLNYLNKFLLQFIQPSSFSPKLHILHSNLREIDEGGRFYVRETPQLCKK